MHTRLHILILLTGLLTVISCRHARPNPNALSDTAAKKAILGIPDADAPYLHQVMVLGTFHFDRSRDGSDVIAHNHLDITTPENQRELERIASDIATAFRPTMIVVEWMPDYQPKMDSLFALYQKKQLKLPQNETFQLGFRIAGKMGLPTVYCVDNRPEQPESIELIDDWEAYAQSLGQFNTMKEYDKSNGLFNDYMDQMLSKLSLKQYLMLVNSPEYLKRYKQFSLTGLVNLGYMDTYIGADLTGNWYRRNTRIFVNIRNRCKTRHERILVIYGAGHKWILDELFSGSPEFEVTQPMQMLD
ncbi:MAG: DUF5694 domain-containing protein [Saprospiraceae bacterium]|nr:DUF5694 domain-containing protein [Saprospiraceae bacterium]